MGIWDEQGELASWIEAEAGGTIVGAEREGRWRVHWLIDVERDGELVELLARMPRDPEYVRYSAFTNHYDTAYEERVPAAMQPTDVPVPRVYGFHGPTETILMERVGGSGDVRALSPERTGRLLDQYVGHLAAIHELPVNVFDGVGAGAPEPVRPGGQLQWIRQDYERARAAMRPESLLEFALWWLDHHLPADHGRRSIVQGDTGPGQFMFDGDRLLALIDWELADIDHPMLDLGVMRMRNVLYPMGRVDSALARYAELSGRPLDVEAVRYFTVVASLVSLLGMASSMQRPSASIDSMVPRLAWDATMRRCLCDALLEACGVDADPPVLPEVVSTNRTPLHDFLVEHLEVTCAPLATDEYGRYLLSGAVGVAGALRLLDQVGAQLDDDDLDDMEVVLGVRPGDRADGDVRLAALVADDPAAASGDLLRMWHRVALRREFAWAPLMIAQGSGPLVPLPDE